jgi:plasmid stabilization system protein ParE
VRISVSSEAQADFDAALDWYLGESAFDAADRFADEFERALTQLQSFPEMGSIGRYRTRAFILPKFPYSLIYRASPDSVRIIAVAHHARHPGYWTGRR